MHSKMTNDQIGRVKLRCNLCRIIVLTIKN